MAVVRNEEAKQFQLIQDGQTAFIDFDEQGDRIELIRTIVPEEIEGHGIGSQLAKFALEYARDHNLQVIPTCPFVSGYIERHQEFQDLVVKEAG